jgi:PIN domain nuclease of toxin-antitoxin system
VTLLVDAHSLIWAVDAPARLSAAALAAVADPANDRVVSAATVWEIAIKVGLGKLTLSQPFRPWMDKALLDLRATLLPITVAYADAQAALPHHHGDPFDRMLVAQAIVEGVAIVSADQQLDAYGVTRIW